MFNVHLVVHGLEYLLRSVSLSILFGGHLITSAVLPLQVILDKVASQFDVVHLLVIPTKITVIRLNR